MGSCTILGLHAFVCVVITLIRGSHGKLYNLRSSCLCILIGRAVPVFKKNIYINLGEIKI